MLAISEIIIQVEARITGERASISLEENTPKEDRIVTFGEFKGNLKTLFRSALIGTSIGALPRLRGDSGLFPGLRRGKAGVQGS